MKISQIAKPSFGIHDSEMNIQISIGLLGFAYHINQFYHCCFDCLVLPLVQGITSAFNPFCNIRVPEEMIRNWPVMWLIMIVITPFQFEGIIPACCLQNIKLVLDCGLGYNIAFSRNERTRGEFCVDKCRLGICHCS